MKMSKRLRVLGILIILVLVVFFGYLNYLQNHKLSADTFSPSTWYQQAFLGGNSTAHGITWGQNGDWGGIY